MNMAPLSKLSRFPLSAMVLAVSAGVCADDKVSSTPAAAADRDAKPSPPAASPGMLNSWLRQQSPAFDPWDLGVQLRARFEHTDNLDAPGAPGVDTKHGSVDFRANGGDANNDHLLLRSLGHLGYTPTPWLNVYVEGKESSSTGDDRSPNVDSDMMDLHQAYLRLGGSATVPFSVKAGRQELIYGDERLIGASDWTNVKRTFDAVKLRYEAGASWVDAFVSRPIVVWDNHFNESNDYEWFSGLYASSTSLIPFQESQFYALSRNVGAGSPGFYGSSPDPQGSSPRDIYTLGLRLKSLPGKLGGWDYGTEFAGQFGHFKETTKGAPASVAGKNLDQEAFAVAAGGGYTWSKFFGSPRLGAEYAYASGDNNPSDGTHGTFDNLFPTNHKFYGIMDLFSWQNVQIGRFTASIKPLKNFTLTSDYRLVWLADTNDSLYTNKGARRGGAVATAGLGYGVNPGFDSFVGSEIDLVGSYTIKPCAVLQAGIGHFFVGDYIKSSLAGLGGATDGNFIYAQCVLSF